MLDEPPEEEAAPLRGARAMSWYATRAGTPAREIEEAGARAAGLQLRELKPIEAAALALLSKGTHMNQLHDQLHPNGEGDTPAQREAHRLLERSRAAAEEPEHELTERLEVRCTASDLARWREAAQAREQSVSAFVRVAARERALHPAFAAGALHGAWLELAQRGLDTLTTGIARAAFALEALDVRGAQLLAAPKKRAKKKLKLKHRDAPTRPGKGRKR